MVKAFAIFFGRHFFSFVNANKHFTFKHALGSQVFQTANWDCLQTFTYKQSGQLDK
jgi:hypothetical protein